MNVLRKPCGAGATPVFALIMLTGGFGQSTNATGFLPGSTNTALSSRWTEGDRGEAILYRVDTDTLPSGITTNQALTAIENAFQAWANATSLRFEFEQIESFGESAGLMNVDDYRIRIQLHDQYGYLSGQLGNGGRIFHYQPTVMPEGGLSGIVDTNRFDLTVAGFVVLDHTKADLSNPLTLEEVLCHEIGHALSLGHSSEDPGETDPELSEAMMYYLVHKDGRGATLKDWDIRTVQLAYPTNNTPPYGYPRYMDVLTSGAMPQPTPTQGVNQVVLPMYDRQDDTVTAEIVDASNVYGLFSITHPYLNYTPNGGYSAVRLDPESGSSYDRALLRVGDGEHKSAPFYVRVLSFNFDGTGDGMPDSWTAQYAGVAGNPDGDADGDGVSNFMEWVHGTNPTNDQSAFRIETWTVQQATWQAKPYEAYEILFATHAAGPFARQGNPILPAHSMATGAVDMATSPQGFYRIRKIP